MKVLKVSSGDDFAAAEFENQNGGLPVNDVLNDLDAFRSDDWDLEVVEFPGTVDPDFIDWIKTEICDYDNLKNTSFYIEGTIIATT